MTAGKACDALTKDNPVTAPLSSSRCGVPAVRPQEPVNPYVDGALGIALVLLLLRFLQHIYGRRAADPTMLGVFCMSLATVGFSIWTTRRCAETAGRFISQRRSGPHIPPDCRDPLSDSVLMKKFKDQAWQLVAHSSMAIWEVRLLRANPSWWEDPRRNIPCPGSSDFSAELNLFVTVQVALWLITGVSCKFFEERRKDYLEMLVHHVITVALILTAIVNGELGFMVVTLVVHDLSDVVLDLMKLANYMNLDGAHSFFMTEMFFVANHVLWVYLRLFYFPWYVIGGQFLGYQERCMDGGPQEATFNLTKVPLWISARSLFLAVLFLLHIFWFYLLNRIAFKLLRGQDAKSVGDEEYEGNGKKKSM